MADGAKKRKAAPGDVATNRQAAYRYDLLDKLEAGMVLGTEVKSLRDGKAQLKDGYAAIRDGELWLHNVHIPPYAPAARDNHEPERPRKLLDAPARDRAADRQDARAGPDARPDAASTSTAAAKVEIALARGKDVGDKRQAIKEREMKREMERARRR